MNSQVRVNISTLVNSSKIRREKRNGRDVIIVPSATLPDNVIMRSSGNGPSVGGGIKYPAEEIERAFKGLEGTIAPLGHPMVNGKFVSARSPDGLARGYVGAHNENVRRENGRVLLDKVIDVMVANQSEGGRALLSAIEKQEPIHTSTGLLAVMELANAADHKYVARNMHFDHDAILLNQTAAATPEQGVGIFVNSAGDEVEVINSSLPVSPPEQELPKDEIMLRDSFVSFMKAIIRGAPEPMMNVESPNSGHEQEISAMDEAKFAELLNKALDERPAMTEEKVAEIVANALKPITDAQDARDKADAEKAEAERTALVNKVVEAKILTEDEAKDVPVAALNALLKETPRMAYHVNAAFKAPTEKSEYKLPAGE